MGLITLILLSIMQTYYIKHRFLCTSTYLHSKKCGTSASFSVSASFCPAEHCVHRAWRQKWWIFDDGAGELVTSPVASNSSFRPTKFEDFSGGSIRNKSSNTFQVCFCYPFQLVLHLDNKPTKTANPWWSVEAFPQTLLALSSFKVRTTWVMTMLPTTGGAVQHPRLDIPKGQATSTFWTRFTCNGEQWGSCLSSERFADYEPLVPWLIVNLGRRLSNQPPDPKCYAMHCFGTCLTHAQTCDNVRVQSVYAMHCFGTYFTHFGWQQKQMRSCCHCVLLVSYWRHDTL